MHEFEEERLVYNINNAYGDYMHFLILNVSDTDGIITQIDAYATTHGQQRYFDSALYHSTPVASNTNKVTMTEQPYHEQYQSPESQSVIALLLG